MTFANPDVLEFYRKQPFNDAESPAAMAANIRRHDPAEAYPPLRMVLRPGQDVLDAGCGTGWFANAMSYHAKSSATGIDFNPVAIRFAQLTASALNVPTTFLVEDLFVYRPAGKSFDVVTSLGVLHHTNDCAAAVRQVCSLVKPGGYAFIGLYHRYGRRPFLEHFRAMAASGATEKEQLSRFRVLFGAQHIDETHLTSWFRDQVLHPHETQHTLAEMVPVLEESGMRLVATSLNDFKPLTRINAVLEAEPALEEIGRERLRQNAYYPGFFVFLAQRRP